MATLQDLAGVLRALRRRHARRSRDAELTYRELAARTGSSTAAIAEYLTGRTLPPTDRFDVLIGLLGATPAEQGVLATARDRVAEQHRRGPVRTTHASTPRRAVPRQLPGDVYAFKGRGDQLSRLDAMLGSADGAGAVADAGPVLISAVSGTAGIGKTALAVHWAHLVADRFPDGQLFIDLRGYDPESPMLPGDALTRLLTALGVSGAEIPLDVDDRAARYRTQLADRRMLIVLDNAATVEQVRPLLPGTGSCVVVVTSRDSLAGLVVRDGARRVDLDLLPPDDAVALLGQLIGARATREPEALAALARLCARLPLALRIAAELAAASPGNSLAELATELADRQARLELMDAGGDSRAAVTEVFSWSVQYLPTPAARTFRLLGLHPGPDLDRHAVAALTGSDPGTARRSLDLLARANLVHLASPGRYGMHDLLRAYAARLAGEQERPADLRVAQRRLFDVCLATAAAAMDRLDPVDAGNRPRAAAPEELIVEFSDERAARAWLDAERSNLVAIAAYTATAGWPEYAVKLSTILFRYLDAGHYTEALTVHAHARRAAELTADPSGQAYALLALGTTYLHLCDYRRATGVLRPALALFRQVDDLTGQSRVLSCLGNIDRRQGDYRTAEQHLRRALDLVEAAGDLPGQARALINLGGVELHLGRPEIARDQFQRALALAQRAGDRLSEAVAVQDLGLVEQQLNRPAAAARHLRQSLEIARRLGLRQGEADALESLGTVCLGLGEPESAIGYLTQALNIYNEIGDRHGQAWSLNGLGDAALAAGRPADALAHHTEALAVATDIGAADQLARAHAGLGRVHRGLGDSGLAGQHLRQALTGYTELRSGEADTVRTLLGELCAPPDQRPAPAG